MRALKHVNNNNNKWITVLSKNIHISKQIIIIIITGMLVNGM